MSFDPDKFLKETESINNNFDPDAFIRDTETSEKESRLTDATLEGYGNGLTLGYLSQLQAKLEPITDRIANLFDGNKDAEIAPWSQLFSNDDNYIQSRDSNIKRQKNLAEQHPVAYHGAQAAGAINSAIVASPLQGANTASSAMKIGGMYGLLSNPGDVEGIVDELQLTPRLKNAVIGAMTGYGAQVGLDKIAKVSKPLAQKIAKLAERRAAKAMGWQKHLSNKFTQSQIDDAGRFALDEDILKPSFWDNTGKMIKRNKTMLDDAGSAMDDVYSQIDDVGASEFNPLETATKVDDELGGFWRDPINKSETRQFDNTIETILNRGDENISIKDAQLLKQKLGKAANWKNSTNVTDKERMARDAYKIVNRELDESVGRSAGKLNIKGLKESLQAAKKKYGAGKTIESLLENKVKQGGNNLISLTDFVVGTGATSTMGPSGLFVLAGKKLSEKYGNQVAAKTLDKIAKNLMKVPKLAHLPDKNPVAFQALVYRMASRSDDRAAAGAVNFLKAADGEVKGRDKWIATGLDRISSNVNLDDPKVVKKLLFDKKGENLLAQASSLKPDSKAMKNLISKINKHLERD